MKTRRPWVWMIVLGTSALLLGACSDDGGNGNTTAHADTSGDGGGDTPADTPLPDTPTPDTPVGDNGTPDVPFGDGRAWITSACTEFNEANVTFPAQTTDGRDIRMIVEAVDFRTSTFVVRNVSDSAFAFVSDVRRMCANNIQSNCTDATYTVPAGARVAIHMARITGETQPAHNDDEIFVWGNPNAFSLSADSGEVGVRDNSNSNDVAEMFEAFVIWGADPPSAAQSGRNEAASVGLWVSDDAGAFVATSSGDVGIVATGDVTDPDDWVVVDGDCFPENLIP